MGQGTTNIFLENPIIRRLYLDILLQILIPNLTALEGIEKSQKIYSWGGTDYPQEPVTYHWGTFVEMVPSQVQPFIYKFLPNEYSEKLKICLDIKGQGLDLLKMEVNGEEVDWYDRRLDDLLNIILSRCDLGVLIFEPHYDQIDSVNYLEVNDCIQKLKDNLKRDRQKEGFIAITKHK
jgi:hypothetical protein